MNKLTALVVKRPILVIVFCLFTGLAGTIALGSLTRQEYPNIDLPAVAVTAESSNCHVTALAGALICVGSDFGGKL